MSAPIYHTWVIMSNHHPGTARDGNPGKLLPNAPPLFGSPAMNWDHAVRWGSGVWVSVSDIGRVGQPELVVGQPELEKPRKRVSCSLAWVMVRQNHPCVVKRRAPSSSGHANAYRWCSLPRVRLYRTSKPSRSLK